MDMGITDWIDIVLLLAGCATLIVGYRRDNRKIMLVAAILLLCSCAFTSFATGFADGVQDAMESRES